jgi:hypothetical protein
VLLGAVATLLVMASAKVATLQLAHASGRQRELAVRRALGGIGERGRAGCRRPTPSPRAEELLSCEAVRTLGETVDTTERYEHPVRPDPVHAH